MEVDEEWLARKDHCNPVASPPVKLTGAKTPKLIGDINQLPFIDRRNLFKTNYIGPNFVMSISQKLSRSYRCPLDVTYALNNIYGGIFSA